MRSNNESAEPISVIESKSSSVDDESSFHSIGLIQNEVVENNEINNVDNQICKECSNSHQWNINDDDDNSDININMTSIEDNCICMDVYVEDKAKKMKIGDKENIRLYLDNCCVGGHLVNDNRLLKDSLDTVVTVQTAVGKFNIEGLKGNVDILGKGYYLKNADRCLLSLEKLKDELGISYKKEGDEPLTLTKNGRKLKAKFDSDNKLYYTTLRNLYELCETEKTSIHMSSIDENQTAKRVINTEIRERAKKVLKLHAAMGHIMISISNIC
jgi:hypothetical protein